MSAHPTRHPCVVLHHSSHRPLAALTACILAALGNGASAPYLTVGDPEPMRVEPPPTVAAPFKVAVVKPATEEDKARPFAFPIVLPPAPAVVAATPATSPEPPKAPPSPKYELVPDPVQTKPTRLEDILPYFVPPPAPPVSKATYEEK
jgi:hypothetical protein